MNIDFTKPLQQSNGKRLRLLCTDAAGDYPVFCLREEDKTIRSFTLDGRAYKGIEDNPNNLMNVPEQVTVDVWINIYDTSTTFMSSSGFSTKKEALEIAATYSHLKRRATLHITRTVPVGHVDEE